MPKNLEKVKALEEYEKKVIDICNIRNQKVSDAEKEKGDSIANARKEYGEAIERLKVAQS